MTAVFSQAQLEAEQTGPLVLALAGSSTTASWVTAEKVGRFDGTSSGCHDAGFFKSDET